MHQAQRLHGVSALQRGAVSGTSWHRDKGQSWHGQHQARKGDRIRLPHPDGQLKSSPLRLLHRCRVTHVKVVKTPGAKKCWGRSNMPSAVKNKHTSFGLLRHHTDRDVNRCQGEEAWEELPCGTLQRPQSQFTSLCCCFPAVTEET